MEKITKTLIEYFEEVEIVKKHYGYFYDVVETIIITILGTFCGLKNLKQIQQWASDSRTRRFLSEKCGITEIPCYSWFTQIIGLIKPESFNDCFIRWALNLVSGYTGKATVSIDGKTVRSTGKMQCYSKPLHIVSGHLAELGITLGQKAVSDKSNEIPAVRELIEMLNIEGCLVVADALNCQTETVKAIVENGGDYLLSVKDNQPTLKSDISSFIDDEETRQIMASATKTEKNRDRIETRTAYVANDIGWLFDTETWAKLTCIGAINTQFETTAGISNEWHYYISSRELTPEELLKHARLEWSVETMHWLLDVHFEEDFCRVCDQNSQENLNIIRKIVLNCIRNYKNEHDIKKPFSNLMFECLLNPDNIVKFL